MTESEDEVDYMSEDILFECTKNDIRPGLIQNTSYKRKIEVEKKRIKDNEEMRKKIKPIKDVQKERLKVGLDTAIEKTNKGFSMLQKMGYQPGMSLGKEGKGRLEPINLVVKADRVGLGWQELIKYKKMKYEERKQHKSKQLFDPAEFRARMSNQHHQKKMLIDLAKSQKMCYNLDSREGILNPHEYWFWPSYALEDEDQEEGEEINEEEEIFEPSEQLEILTSYLRSTYFYCIWCSSSYSDQEDLEKECPGSTRADHD